MATEHVTGDAKKIEDALALILRYGGIQGDHHSKWCIDQIVRVLTGDGYAAWVVAAKEEDGDPDAYDWDEGIPP